MLGNPYLTAVGVCAVSLSGYADLLWQHGAGRAIPAAAAAGRHEQPVTGGDAAAAAAAQCKPADADASDGNATARAQSSHVQSARHHAAAARRVPLHGASLPQQYRGAAF